MKSNTNLEEGKFSPSGKIRSRHEKLKSVGSNSSNGFRKTSPCFGKALPSTHSLHRIGEEWTGPAAGANDEEMTRYFANLSSDTGDLNKKQSVRFMGESSNGSTGFQMFRPVSMTSCVSGISETSVKQRGSGAGGDSFNSPSEGSPLLAGTLSYKKSGQIALRNLDDLDEDCVAEWADDDDIRNGGMVTNRSDYKDKLDTSPQSYQDNTESCSKSRVPDSMDEYDSDEEGLTNRLDLEHHDADGDDECYQDDGNDEECDSVASHSLDDDDEDDLGDELVHLDDDLLASALEDLCVQRPRGDPTDWQWNVISADLDIGGYLVCPANNENLKLGLRFGKAEAIGGRQYMEDRIFASSALPEEGTENFELAFFGVFDSHNGEYVADLLQTRMHAALLSHISAENVSKSLCDDGKMSEPSSPTTGGIAFNSDNEFSDSGGEGKDRGRSPGPATASLGDCFVRTAAELDLQILTRDYQRQQCSLHTGTLDVQTFAGCVLATMTVTSAPNATHYIPLPANTNPTKTDMVSWIKRDKPPRWIRKDKAMAAGIGGVNVMVGHTGDCRAVLSEKGGVARVLTGDHKPQLASEKERIEVAGGWVHNNRVNGVLAVSRSFGDIQYKTFDGTTRFLTVDEKGGIWNKTQQVISKPDILEFSVDGTHEFVVIASDGLWDVFTSQECINYVRWQLKQQGGDITRTAEALVSAAFARGTADNTSVVIVAFNQLDTSDRRIDVSGSVSVCPVISPNSKTSKSPKVFIRLP